MEAPEVELRLRSVAPSDAPALVALAGENLHSYWTEAFVLWKYFENPAGRIHGCCAEIEGQIVGFYGNAPLRIKVGSEVIAGAQALDAMVTPAARRHGLFVKLGDWVHTRMAEAGVAVSYGIPNPVSRAGLVKRMGWDYPGEIPRYVRVLQPTAVVEASGLKGVKALVYRLALRAVQALHPSPRSLQVDSRVRIREVEAFDARFDDLWAQVAGDFPIAVVRDCTYLMWRYAQNPLLRYTILIAERDGVLCGYTILSHRDMEEGVLAVAELVVVPGDASAGLALLAAATAYAQKAGAAQVQCWMLPQYSFYARLLERSGFIYGTSRFLPGLFRYTTSLIVKLPAGSALSPDPRHLVHWYMTMGDQDYY